MLIACLGWGSLIWKPDALPVASEWFLDGPQLAIEFARVSDGGELATVKCANAPPCQVLWAVLDVGTVEEACEALRVREQIPKDRQDGIGIFTPGNALVGVIAEWAIPRQLDAVIWTDLPPRYEDVEGLVPTVDDAVSYLAGLSGEAHAHARVYLERVPAQIDTPYRREIISRLGWQ
ncbi:hypothetical protein SAMN03159437_02836 [Pseudomonas sp. NFACC25]|uniref:hypothetical protein n=1 Tax=Pseudomonas sp. NFACC25 TaxID=1566188 RepID=UPI0008773CB7|nr:hypothetical protein [Pseudomonas sp. NFACC25]SCX26838.1 hypothetical protein SAMN03159437_02836 [Pseudomonas sp. NFACC25]